MISEYAILFNRTLNLPLCNLLISSNVLMRKSTPTSAVAVKAKKEMLLTSRHSRYGTRGSKMDGVPTKIMGQYFQQTRWLHTRRDWNTQWSCSCSAINLYFLGEVPLFEMLTNISVPRLDIFQTGPRIWIMKKPEVKPTTICEHTPRLGNTTNHNGISKRHGIELTTNLDLDPTITSYMYMCVYIHI